MPDRISLAFPGQGSQYVGMGKAFHETYPEARRIFEEAADILGFDLAKVLFEGEAERVDSTRLCQPGILVTSMAILEVLRQQGLLADIELGPTLGLSLGEYTALVFAGALRFADAVDLVAKRGAYMQECSDKHPSGMLSLMGSDLETAKRLCSAVRTSGVLGVANLNSPGQVVVSGARAALDEARSRASEFGIRRAIPLKVAGAFHSELMDEAATRLREDLAKVIFSTPEIPVVSNVTARPTTDPDEIRRNLAEQVKAPVLFQMGVETCLALGTTHFLEPGPKNVLCGLVGKIAPGTPTVSIDSPADVDAFAATTAAKGGTGKT